MAIVPFYGAHDRRLFAIERAAMDHSGRVVSRLRALLPASGRILDVGAGDGWTAARIAAGGREVVALEPAAGMVAQRRSGDDLLWIRGEAGALPLADGSVAAAYATWAYFFPSFLDPSRGLDELHRVVAPGGPIVVVNNAGDDELTRLGVRSGGEPTDWFTARGFDVEVVDTAFEFDEPEGARRLLAAYLGTEERVPDPPPTSVGHRVTVATTRSTGPPSVRVRGMRCTEAEAVGAMTLEAYDTYGPMEGDYRGYLADPLRRLDGCTALLVAERDGDLLGTASFVLPGDAEWEGRPEPEADSGMRVLAVRPGAEGQGVGRALVDACLQRARERRCHRMIVTSMEWMTRAHRLYTGFGFVRRPDLDVRFPGGRGVTFTLDLTDEAPARFPPPGPEPDVPPWYEDAWSS